MLIYLTINNSIYRILIVLLHHETTTKLFRLKIKIMNTTFELLKNGNNAVACFSNPTTKQIVTANRNSFGYNVIAGLDKEFDNLAYDANLKKNQNKGNCRVFSYSKKDVESLGFELITRGFAPNF